MGILKVPLIQVAFAIGNFADRFAGRVRLDKVTLDMHFANTDPELYQPSGLG